MRPWNAENLRDGGLLESSEPLRRSGLPGISSPWSGAALEAARDGAECSGTGWSVGRRAMRAGRPWSTLAVVAADGRRAAAVSAPPPPR